MARPNILQKLRGGKILCGNVFPFFVETWNWLVGSYDNLRGDFDTNPNSGAITVDKTDPDHPVIRLRTDNIKVNNAFTGSLKRITGMSYSLSSHQFTYESVIDTYEGGILKSSATQPETVVFTSIEHVAH